MSYDPNRSPVGWYVASYLLRFVEIQATRKDNPRRKFLSWENTVLVRARSLEHAYATPSRSAGAGRHCAPAALVRPF